MNDSKADSNGTSIERSYWVASGYPVIGPQDAVTIQGFDAGSSQKRDSIAKGARSAQMRAGAKANLRRE